MSLRSKLRFLPQLTAIALFMAFGWAVVDSTPFVAAESADVFVLNRENVVSQTNESTVGNQDECIEVTAPPSNDQRWNQGLSLEVDNQILGGNIVAFKIRYQSGEWSEWFVPGVNDISKDVQTGKLQRIWSRFVDCEHRYLICKPRASQPTRTGRALTWKKLDHIEEFEIDLVGTSGGNPYDGDTSIGKALPILAIKVDGAARPPYAITGRAHAMAKEFYRGWAGGQIALTPPIQGSQITSLEAANEFCRKHCGEGFRMAEFHDGRYIPGMARDRYFDETWHHDRARPAGWNFYAYGNLPTDTRFWVWINDQRANPWD